MAEHFFGMTDVGRQRDGNEDTFVAKAVARSRYVLAAVIDGVGGYEGGEVAAGLARDTIEAFLGAPAGPDARLLREALVRANDRIIRSKAHSPDLQHMSCVATVVLADARGKKFWYAHVGDTRLYLLRDRTLVKVSKDHSFVGLLEDAGRLTETEAMAHPKRNEINRALGFDLQIPVDGDYIDSGESPFLPGDLLLLCSDGLTDLVPAAEITAILNRESTLEEKSAALIDAANRQGGKDNITVVLVRNHFAAKKQEVTRPGIPVKKKEIDELDDEEDPSLPVLPPTPQLKRGIRTWTIAMVVGLVLMAGAAWWWLNQEDTPSARNPVAAVQNDSAMQAPATDPLSDSLRRFTGSTFQLTPAAGSRVILLRAPLVVSRDSLRLVGGSNLVVRADSAYFGPALKAAPENKFLHVEGVVFEGFEAAIQVAGGTLRLKNVRFHNCVTGVLAGHVFPDNQFVNGTLGRKSPFATDSIPKE